MYGIVSWAKEQAMSLRKIVTLLVITMLISAPATAWSESKQVNLTGGGLWQGSVTSLVKEEVSQLRTGHTLTIFADEESKGMVAFAIKTEELPVVFEEITKEDLTRFVIRLK